MASTSRGKAMREARRAAQFSKFRLINLNLVPLVDTFVSIVFFALTTQTLGAVAPVVKGVTLPQSSMTATALEQFTVGITPSQVLLGSGENMRPVMTTAQAAQQASNVPGQPLVIPGLYAALRATADSIRATTGTPENESIRTVLAVQAEKNLQYAVLARVIQTARMAGFRNITLQVLRAEVQDGEPAPAPTT